MLYPAEANLTAAAFIVKTNPASAKRSGLQKGERNLIGFAARATYCQFFVSK